MIEAAAVVTASIPEAQFRATVRAGTWRGIPARMATTRTDMAQILGQLSAGQRNRPKSPAQFLAMAKAGMGMVPEMVGFLTRRSEVLLEVEMGLGEDYYTYAVGY